MLSDFYHKTPDLISEQQLQDYFLRRKNVDKWSAATMRLCYSGVKFFFVNVLKRQWHTLVLVHAKREQRLPTVLSVKTVRRILSTVNTPQNKAYLTTVYLSMYSTGLLEQWIEYDLAGRLNPYGLWIYNGW